MMRWHPWDQDEDCIASVDAIHAVAPDNDELQRAADGLEPAGYPSIQYRDCTPTASCTWGLDVAVLAGATDFQRSQASFQIIQLGLALSNRASKATICCSTVARLRCRWAPRGMTVMRHTLAEWWRFPEMARR